MAGKDELQCLFERRPRFCNCKKTYKKKTENNNYTTDNCIKFFKDNKLRSYINREDTYTEADGIKKHFHKMKRIWLKNRTKYKTFHNTKHKIIIVISSFSSKENNLSLIKQNSMPDTITYEGNCKILKPTHSAKVDQKTKRHIYSKEYIVNNFCQTCDKHNCTNPFMNPNIQAKIYRCQLNSREETCCCSCNSDAMFEVMKSLYDCYKKKNCDHCNCILCGALPADLKVGLGEQKSVAVGVGEEGIKDKIAKAKAAGLLTPLQGKSPQQMEKILKGLVDARLPLPEGKSASEKKIIDKVRKELGLPPEPKTAAERAKMNQAQAAGIITPLEGKTIAQKEKALRKMAKAGIPLPEGRTVSEKAIIDKVKAEVRATLGAIPVAKIPSEKLRKAKAAGLLTPLTGKTATQKEKILKGLIDSRLPLPEGKTASEKKLIDKIRRDMGLPPEPKTAEERAKMDQALAAGIITPLEGKNAVQKEKALRKMAEAGIPLPEGRTASEKALIEKVNNEVGRAPGALPVAKYPSEKLRKAKAAGLLTPLAGKTPKQKEKILKGLIDARLPLPEGKTASEKKLIDKIRRDMGLPPEPKTAEERAKMDQALAAGIITPLEGKNAVQKEKALRKMAEAGIPLPEGRTASEKALIEKVNNEVGRAPGALPVAKYPSEKLRKAKAAGLLTPLAGKTPKQKEKILKGLIDARLPLPEGKTASEKKLVDKIRRDMGLPPEPKTAGERAKMDQALAAGIITPLEGKNAVQKEKALRKMAEAGIPLPEGRTASEKALIEKVNNEVGRAPGALPVAKYPSEKLRKAKAAGLLTPLAGKTPKQKEKILKGLIDARLPLPEGKTASEKKLIDKIRRDMGLPPEPKTAEDRAKMDQALAAGIITPLEGKNAVQKEKALRKMAEAGIPLPEGRTASEKALIEKVNNEVGKAPGALPVAKYPSEKLRKAKAAGLLTPLAGKTPKQKEKILKGLIDARLPLPEGKTASEKKLVDKIRRDMGLPPEPKSAEERAKMDQALAAGIITPLEGKNAVQKEKALRKMAEAGIPLPEGRTASEKALIEKVNNEVRRAPGALPVAKYPSEKLRKAKAAGLLTPLAGKTPKQKEKILKGLIDARLPLPEGKTASEKKLVDKIRRDMGLPPEPKTAEERAKMDQALAAGIITPLEGKNAVQKEQALRKMAEAGIPLPEGRTASEKALIEKVKNEVGGAPGALPIAKYPSEKLRKAKAAGLLTPLAGKTPKQKEKILKGLIDARLPLPEGKTASEKKLVDKIRRDMGLPPEPKTAEDRAKMNQALAAGIITPLEGKNAVQKEKALRKMAEAGIPLPEGRTASEKALIDKVNAEVGAAPGALPAVKYPSEKLQKAKAAGLLTPLAGKTPKQKEKILKGLIDARLPLPEGKTASEKKLVDKIRRDMGLPPEPKTAEERAKMNQALAAGIITPLEGKNAVQKEKALRKMAEAGIPLPEGRTASEKALINKVRDTSKPLPVTPSDKLRKAKAEGLLTPLAGKTPEQKSKILKGLAKHGLPLPAGKSPSEKKLIEKVRKDMGLPPEPKNSVERQKLAKAHAAGIISPLEGKSPADKEKILRRMAEAGVTLPEGRTASEKALINKIKGTVKPLQVEPSEKLRKAKAEGLLTPIAGKSPEQKTKILNGLAKQGLPLPEGKTPSEKKLIDKVRKDLGLPPEPKNSAERLNLAKAHAAGIISPLEGKSPADKEKILRRMAEAGVPLPEGRTASEKALINKIRDTVKSLPSKPSEKLRKAKAEGLLTPLAGKTPEQKTKILKGLAKLGLPLPEGKTASEKKLIDKIRKDMGLPPEPKNSAERQNLAKAHAAGIISPLEGKSPAAKEKILRRMAEAGLSLPEGRTASEKALISKVKDTVKPLTGITSENLRKAKAEGLLTPLSGKTPEQKAKILKGLAKMGLPLPEGKTPSEKKLIEKVRKDMGLPPEPKNSLERQKLAKAHAAGVISPLEGKSAADKEKALRRMAEAGIPLPEGRTASERALIDKVRETVKQLPRLPSEKLRKAKAEGLLTPLAGKSPQQKAKILKGLAKLGLPLPEAKTPSEKKLIDNIRRDMGLPPEPRNSIERQKLVKAHAAGIISPLEGKSPADKEKLLRRMADAGVPLPEGRTASEKKMISKVRGLAKPLPDIPSEKLRRAKAEGLLTPLAGKTPEQKAKILKGLAEHGLPLPEGKTPSEIKLIDKIRKDLGLPPEPKNSVERQKLAKAHAAGIISPLEGKSPADKEKVLRRMAEAGVPLPEGRTASEKDLISKVRGTVKPLLGIPSEKLRRAKAEGLLTPLAGKSPEQRTKILNGLARLGLPLPEGKTPSEKKIIEKIRKDMGLPPEPKNSIERQKLVKAHAAGIISPLEGKSPADKEKVLSRMAEAGIPLPEGRTASEKALISKVRGLAKPLPDIPSEKLRRAKAEGLLTPLAGKTPEQKAKILKGLAKHGLPLPEGKTPSEKKIIDKVRKDMGLPPEPKNSVERQKLAKAHAAGIISPLEGKSPAAKEKILRRMAEAGIPLPEGRTASEKVLIDEVKANVKPKSAIDMRRLGKTGRPALAPDERAKLDKQTANVKEGKGPSDECICDLLTPESERPRAVTLSAGKIPSEKLRKAKAEGLLTPLDGKTPAQKDKILTGLAAAGLPLPEGKTTSEKALINKIKTELGLAPTAATPSEREIIKRAKAEGLLTPLAGKTPEQKAKIIKGLLEAGLPVPEGKTLSEKDLIKKIRKEAGLPIEPTPSERTGKIRKKTIGVGGAAAKAKAKGVGAGEPLAKGGITEEEQEIIKTTKCDRACGCDKKKIRFKHSYVKIRVTSPDISSFCSCPEECIPGVKGGVFVDNEGIKVTVGRVTGIPSYTHQSPAYSKTLMSHVQSCYSDESNTYSEGENEEYWDNVNNLFLKNVCAYYKKFNDINASYYNGELLDYDFSDSQANMVENKNSIYNRNKLTTQVLSYSEIESHGQDGYLVSCSDVYSSTDKSFMSLPDNIKITSSALNIANNNSLVLLQTESDFKTSCSSYSSDLDTISIISIDDHDNTSNSEHSDSKSIYELQEVETDGSAFSDSETCYTNISASDTFAVQDSSIGILSSKLYTNFRISDQVIILRYSASKHKKEKPFEFEVEKEPQTFINDKITKHKDVMKIVAEILTEKTISENSSVFVLVPTEDTNLRSIPIADQKHCVTPNFLDMVSNKFPIVTSENQMSNAARGMKLISLPKGIVKEKNRKPKSKKTKEYDKVKTNLNNNTQNRAPLTSHKDVPEYLNHQVMENSQISSKNRHIFGFDIAPGNVVLLKDKTRLVNNIKPTPTYTRTSVLPRMSEPKYFTSISTEMNECPPEKETKIKGVDTSCDRPCCCIVEKRATKNQVIDTLLSTSLTSVHCVPIAPDNISRMNNSKEHNCAPGKSSPHCYTEDYLSCKCPPANANNIIIKQTPYKNDIHNARAKERSKYARSTVQIAQSSAVVTDARKSSTQGNQSKSIQNDLCNSCCSRGKIAEALSAIICDPCRRESVSASASVTFPDKSHSRYPIRGHGSAHSCCCPDKRDVRLTSSEESLDDCAEYRQACKYVQKRRNEHSGIKSASRNSDLQSQDLSDNFNNKLTTLVQSGACGKNYMNMVQNDRLKCVCESAQPNKGPIIHRSEQNVNENVRRPTVYSNSKCQCDVCCQEATELEDQNHVKLQRDNVSGSPNRTFQSLQQSVESISNLTRKMIDVLGNKIQNIPPRQIYDHDRIRNENFCEKTKKQKADLEMLIPCGSFRAPPPLQPFIHLQRIGKRDGHLPSAPQLRFLDAGKNSQCFCKRQSGPYTPGADLICLCGNAENCTCNPPSSNSPDIDAEEPDDYIYNIEDIAWINKRVNVELQSDLTQTTSGFKVSKKPKPNEYEDIDAIAYYEELGYYDELSLEPPLNKTCLGCGDDNCTGLGPLGQLPPKPEGQQIDIFSRAPEYDGKNREKMKPAKRDGHDACVCESKEAFEQATYVPPEGDVYCECKKGGSIICECRKGSVLCECPSEPSLPPTQSPTSPPLPLVVPPNSIFEGEGPPPGGFKFTVGAKGTGSQGLKGICCFDVFEDYTEKHLKSSSESSTSSTYLVYTT